MPSRGWVGWLQGNRLMAGGLAVCTGLFLAGVTGVATHSSDSHRSGQVVAGASSGETTTTLALPDATAQSGSSAAASGATATTRAGSVAAGSAASKAKAGTAGRPGVLPGTAAAPPCTPLPSKETGVTNDSLSVGIILSASSVTYAQFQPSYEGVAAYMKLVNDAGGVCGRKIKIDYSNDNLNPATHDYSSMIHKDFAFVGSFGLLDELDYQTDAPFNPTSQDNGEYVPDIGNIALSYGRAQSPWFAGPTGSVGPSLINPSSLKLLVDEAKANGHACGKAGIHYLVEPSGASQAGAMLSGAALAESWGAGMGSGNINYYTTNIGDPQPVFDTMVRRMVADGVHCVFSYDGMPDLTLLTKALQGQAVWPPKSCNGPTCMAAVYYSLAGNDPALIRDTGGGAEGITVVLTHAPFNEVQTNSSLAVYLKAIKAIPGAQAGSISLLGFASGEMFVEALQACGGAPTRACVMDKVRALKNFTAGNLVSGVTPFRTTRVDCSGGCNNFNGRGVYDWKWPTNCDVTTRISSKNGALDFYRIRPATGYQCADMHVAIGKAA